MLEIVQSPWENTFVRLLKDAKTSVYLASPFIKRQTASLIAQNIRSGIDFRYINSFKLAYFNMGSSDLDALRILKEKDCRQKNIHNLHAKLFVFDDAAIITSGNLTPGGLRNNLEYGVLIHDEIVSTIKRDYLNIFNNREYPEITLDIINKAEDILRSVPHEKRKKINVKEKSLFEEILNDENIEERFDGGIPSIVSNLPAWKKDVFDCLLKIHSDVFTLKEVYAFERELRSLHPKNQHVQEKIRQQLQYLRELGLVEFTKPGIYKKLWVLFYMISAKINGISCFVCYDEWLSSEKAPLGYPYTYYLRHDEEDWTRPVNIEPFVFVNFWGTVFMKDPLEFGSGGYIDIHQFNLDKKYVKIRLRGSILEQVFELSTKAS